jgi:hypothetical protein
MRVAEITTERIVLTGSSPLFKPFFLGGLGLMASGIGILLWAMTVGLPLNGPLPGNESSMSVGGLSAFLAPFGFFLALVPYFGALPYQKEVVVDRAAGRLTRCDRSLRGLQQDTWTLREIQSVEVEELKHADGDSSYNALLKLESGKSIALDRFVDRGAAEQVVQLIRSYLEAV